MKTLIIGMCLLVLIVAAVALAAWLGPVWIGGIKQGVTDWWSSITDPTERGCAYIATAIAAIAVVLAFKDLSGGSK